MKMKEIAEIYQGKFKGYYCVMNISGVSRKYILLYADYINIHIPMDFKIVEEFNTKKEAVAYVTKKEKESE